MIISTVNIKGGSSKSTTAVHLVHYLQQQGFTVALVDCDRQMSASAWIEVACPEILTFCSDEIDDIEDTINELENKYDAVVVDTAGSSYEIMMMVIGLSNHVVIPVCPSEYDTDSAKETIKAIVRCRKRYNKKITATVFLSKVRKNTLSSSHTHSTFEQYEGIYFSNVQIPLTERLVRLIKTENTALTANNCKDLAESYNSLFAPLLGE